jgi:hypothetical protein
MRLLGEIIVIGALVYVGWEKPFTQWIHGPPPAIPPQPRPIVRASPTPSGAWMRDPNRRTSLDSPSGPTNYPQHSQSAPGAWMWDPNHHSPLDAPRKAGTPH